MSDRPPLIKGSLGSTATFVCCSPILPRKSSPPRFLGIESSKVASQPCNLMLARPVARLPHVSGSGPLIVGASARHDSMHMYTVADSDGSSVSHARTTNESALQIRKIDYKSVDTGYRLQPVDDMYFNAFLTPFPTPLRQTSTGLVLSQPYRRQKFRGDIGSRSLYKVIKDLHQVHGA